MSKYFSPVSDLTLGKIINLINAKLIGNANLNKVITEVLPLQKAGSHSITFLSNKKYYQFLNTTKAYACIVGEDIDTRQKFTTNLLVVNNPYGAYATLLQHLYPSFATKITKEYISKKAFIHVSAKIGANCHIEKGAYISEDVTLGNNVYIGANVILYPKVTIGNDSVINSLCSIKYAEIGNNCLIAEGVRIGQDGFGFAPTATGIVKIPHIGGVVIEDDVEIGANTCIDRGVLENTIIRKGTKIDNLVQIGHNVEIGEYCFLAGQVGVAGSSKVGRGSALGGQVGVAPHISIGEKVQIVAQSGIEKDVPNGVTLMGTPARPLYEFWRKEAIINKLLKNK